VALASTIAWRNVPVPAPGAGLTPPLSPLLVTRNVARSARSSSRSHSSTPTLRDGRFPRRLGAEGYRLMALDPTCQCVHFHGTAWRTASASTFLVESWAQAEESRTMERISRTILRFS